MRRSFPFVSLIWLMLPLLAPVSCSTLNSTDGSSSKSFVIPQAAYNVVSEIKHPLPGIDRLKIVRIKAESETTGRAMVQNRRKFLVELFQQSQDPYFGTNRWSDACLERNKIGELKTDRGTLSFSAALSVNEQMQPGTCSEESIDVHSISTYCSESGEFVEIKANGRSRLSLMFECPDKLKLK